MEPKGLKEEFLGRLCAVFLVRGWCPDARSRWSSFPAREHRFSGRLCLSRSVGRCALASEKALQVFFLIKKKKRGGGKNWMDKRSR